MCPPSRSARGTGLRPQQTEFCDNMRSLKLAIQAPLMTASCHRLDPVQRTLRYGFAAGLVLDLVSAGFFCDTAAFSFFSHAS
jgi:hypothetical protein